MRGGWGLSKSWVVNLEVTYILHKLTLLSPSVSPFNDDCAPTIVQTKFWPNLHGVSFNRLLPHKSSKISGCLLRNTQIFNILIYIYNKFTQNCSPSYFLVWGLNTNIYRISSNETLNSDRWRWDAVYRAITTIPCTVLNYLPFSLVWILVQSISLLVMVDRGQWDVVHCEPTVTLCIACSILTTRFYISNAFSGHTYCVG